MTIVAKIGSEILANTATLSSQTNPQITTLSNGGFVGTWNDFSQGNGGATGDSSTGAVKAQVFDAAGSKSGSEILVNTATTGGQVLEQITALPDGGFVVTWQDSSLGDGGATGDASNYAIKAQVFDAAGVKTGSEILVNTATQGAQELAQITTLSNGGFVVTWDDNSLGNGGATGDTSGHAIKAQVFDADGVKTGSEILVNTATNNDQAVPQITGMSNGGFVVTWQDASHGNGGATGDISSLAVKAQVFDAAGAKTGAEILVNTATASTQTGPQITALSNGGFVATWKDFSMGNGGAAGDTSSTAIKTQVFDAAGTKTGGEILVNTATENFQTDQQITALSNGGFVVTWNDQSTGIGGATGDGSGLAVKAQVFDAAGARAGSEILVNQGTFLDQFNPQITALSNGRFVVAWSDFNDDQNNDTGAHGDPAYSVKAQVFDAAGARIGSEVLVNTATNNVQIGPQVTALPDGRFVVTWQDNSGGVGGARGDDSSNAIKAQLFGFAEVVTGTAGADIIDATHAPAGQPFPTEGSDIISAQGGDDVVSGLGGDDTISGGAGNDTLFGNGGNDSLKGGVGDDEMHGEAGNDVYWIGDANDAVIEDADEGIDLVRSSATYTLGDNIERLVLVADSGDINGTGNGLNNVLTGNSGNNTLTGGGGDDILLDGGGTDILLGGDGDDVLVGGAERDFLTGGAGNDRFVLEDPAPADAATVRDVIKDFLIGSDVMDLRTIDADRTIFGDQAFTFIGDAAFGRHAGELRATLVGNGTLVSGDMDGDGRADFQVGLDDPLTLQASDFRL